eukprot:scaffold2571_cov94-Skeletonema_dohrnii-CCMP3373.AAC.1
MIGYDSVEGYIPLLKLYVFVAASLQRLLLPDEAQALALAGTSCINKMLLASGMFHIVPINQ